MPHVTAQRLSGSVFAVRSELFAYVLDTEVFSPDVASFVRSPDVTHLPAQGHPWALCLLNTSLIDQRGSFR